MRALADNWLTMIRLVVMCVALVPLVASAEEEKVTDRRVAAAAGMPLGTVKSHVLRGTEKLRRIIARMDGNG